MPSTESSTTTNEDRSKVLLVNMIVKNLGIGGAQGLKLGDADISAFFIMASILVSIPFAAILLSVTPVHGVFARPVR
ncbi:hypothetical protein [Roseicitreum antarcticum]|uniref:Uncharacterized protein n=1 Tax=Roseicitreum antarcticum TaxID=564137 RepID=A0A1H3FRP9_9RHOB|nr:hypothetical protein [Roseicitreum antarcticum]SDX93600.1 hypothetical protein SAMN04488238_1472 [Roseicitreum antarcticum]